MARTRNASDARIAAERVGQRWPGGLRRGVEVGSTGDDGEEDGLKGAGLAQGGQAATCRDRAPFR
jgi:hypothetical protein